MRRVRIIPVLLIHKGGLVKSVKFKNYRYVGDPINAVKIFNEKEVDELLVLDIDATNEGRGPNLEMIKQLASEAFFPLAYGGGITTIEEVRDLFFLGVEKIVLNTSAYEQPDLISQAAEMVGSQSVVVCIDVKRHIFGSYRAYVRNGSGKVAMDVVEFAKKVIAAGAGEIIINSIDRDGTYKGYDLSIVELISRELEIPVIACGGASSMEDFVQAIDSGASAAAAGSFFVFQRPHNAVLITYPSQDAMKEKVFSRLK